MAVDNNRNLYLAAKSEGTINFGGDELTSIDDYDAVLVKLGP